MEQINWAEIKAIVFDMDGVMIDSERLVLESWKKVGTRYELDDVASVFPECIGRSVADTHKVFIKKYGESFPYEEFREDTQKAFNELEDEGKLNPKPGVYEILDFFQKKGFKLALASSTRMDKIEEILSKLGLLSPFDFVISGDNVKESKPNPEIYLKACEGIKCNPKYCVAIEDSYHGIHSAHNAGMYSIMIPDLKEANDDMRNTASEILNSLGELQKEIEVSIKSK